MNRFEININSDTASSVGPLSNVDYRNDEREERGSIVTIDDDNAFSETATTLPSESVVHKINHQFRANPTSDQRGHLIVNPSTIPTVGNRLISKTVDTQSDTGLDDDISPIDYKRKRRRIVFATIVGLVLALLIATCCYKLIPTRSSLSDGRMPLKPDVTDVVDVMKTDGDQSIYIDRFAKLLYITAIDGSESIIRSHQFDYIQSIIDPLSNSHFVKNKNTDCTECSRLTSSTVCCEYKCQHNSANAIQCYKSESHKQLNNEESSSIPISSKPIPPTSGQVICGAWQFSANETLICTRDPHRIHNLANHTRHKLELDQFPDSVRLLAIDMSNSVSAHLLIDDDENNFKICDCKLTNKFASCGSFDKCGTLTDALMPYDAGIKKMCTTDRYIGIISFQIETSYRKEKRKYTKRNDQLLWTLELFPANITINDHRPYREYNGTTMIGNRQQQSNSDIVFIDCIADQLFVIIYGRRIYTYTFNVEKFL